MIILSPSAFFMYKYKTILSAANTTTLTSVQQSIPLINTFYCCPSAGLLSICLAGQLVYFCFTI